MYTESYNEAMRLLAYRDHSTAQLWQKLLAKGFAKEDIASVIEQLIEQNYLSDLRFAQNYLRYRINGGFGPGRIREELNERGISTEIIDEVLAPEERYWSERAIQARIKRFGLPLPESRGLRAKQQAFLYYRGFLPEHVRAAMAVGKE